MKAYRITRPLVVDEAEVVYCANLSGADGAHEKAKSMIPKPYTAEIYIDELEIPTDKAAIIQILNGGPPVEPLAPVVRSWTLSPRGGLQETEKP